MADMKEGSSVRGGWSPARIDIIFWSSMALWVAVWVAALIATPQ